MSTTIQQGSTRKRRAKAILLFVAPLVLLWFLPVLIAGEAGNLLRAGVVCLGAGALTFREGFSRYRERQLIQNTPTSKIRGLAVGNVEVKGRAHPVEEPLVSPLTHSEACVVEFEVEEEHHDDDGADWVTVFHLREEIAFEVDDGTGRVLVDADDADLEVERERRVHVDDGELPPRPVRDWAQANGYRDIAGDRDFLERVKDGLTSDDEADEHLTGKSIHDRRYTEHVLEVDEETYVFGAAEPREGVESPENPENLVLRRHDGTGRFILSDVPEAELANDKLASTAGLLALAVALLTGGVLLLLEFFGLL